MADPRILGRLIEYGEQLLQVERTGDWFYTSELRADRFVRKDPNAWLFGVLFDQGFDYQKAWAAPLLLKKRLGHLNVRRIAAMPVEQLRRAVSVRPALHRYVRTLPVWVKAAAQKLVDEYNGDASRIWTTTTSMREVMCRLDAFVGIGLKKANMAARFLIEEKGLKFKYESEVNVAVDRHVRRVWERAGLAKDLSIEGIMRAAAQLKPKYPAALDFPSFEIGRNWCHTAEPDCDGNLREGGTPVPWSRSARGPLEPEGNRGILRLANERRLTPA